MPFISRTGLPSGRVVVSVDDIVILLWIACTVSRFGSQDHTEQKGPTRPPGLGQRLLETGGIVLKQPNA
jgi:hypothetical protein